MQKQRNNTPTPKPTPNPAWVSFYARALELREQARERRRVNGRAPASERTDGQHIAQVPALP